MSKQGEQSKNLKDIIQESIKELIKDFQKNTSKRISDGTSDSISDGTSDSMNRDGALLLCCCFNLKGELSNLIALGADIEATVENLKNGKDALIEFLSSIPRVICGINYFLLHYNSSCY